MSISGILLNKSKFPKNLDYFHEVPFAVTICDREGIILAMNARSISTFEKDGGAALIGTSLIDCHPEPSRTKLKELLRTQSKNIYSIEKNGVKKIIIQTPWFDDGEFGGLVELSVELPEEMPHFVRG